MDKIKGTNNFDLVCRKIWSSPPRPQLWFTLKVITSDFLCWLVLVLGPGSFTVVKLKVSWVYVFYFSEHKFHLLRSKAQHSLHWCLAQPWFWLFRCLGCSLVMRRVSCLSLPARPPGRLVMHAWVVVVLICWGTVVANIWGWMRMCSWVSALTSAWPITFSPVVLLCVWTLGTSASPQPLAECPACGRDSGNICRMKKFLIVLTFWVWFRIQTLPSTFANRFSL